MFVDIGKLHKYLSFYELLLVFKFFVIFSGWGLIFAAGMYDISELAPFLSGWFFYIQS